MSYLSCSCNVLSTSAPVRNTFLTDRGIPLPKATSTGTTIVGCLFKDGIILGADTRATEGPIVADKNCEKVRIRSPAGRRPILIAVLPLSDPLHHGQHPMLWCGNGCRHRVHHRSHLLEHGTPFSLHWSQASSSDCDDYAQADALPVCSMLHVTAVCDSPCRADTKGKSALRSFLEV